MILKKYKENILDPVFISIPRISCIKAKSSQPAIIK
jgi:hypothetical protein